MTHEFDPLDYTNLTRHVVEELLRQTPECLADLERFEGSGVYALFYTGDLAYYEGVRSTDASHPIYVGKAIPSGGRKGLQQQGGNRALFDRLADHRKSIESSDNLEVVDFLCRYLVVKPLWISMAERFLITYYTPVWNSCIDGFGNHDPGSGRNGKRSWWDTLHPGRERTWKAQLRPVGTEAEALDRLARFLAGALAPIEDTDD